MRLVNNLKLDAVNALLLEADLPVSDLDQNKLEHFFGIESDKALTGLVGLELYPPVALLRSLVVANAARGQGLGVKLVQQIEAYAQEKTIETIYLLTTSAEDFFLALEYETIDRNTAPDSIKQTAEYSGICPASATVMRKTL